MANYSVSFAESLMKIYPEADSFPFKSWSYPQGFMLWGFIRLYELTGREDFRNYVLEYCESHVNEEGVIDLFAGQSLDSILPASVIIWAYSVTGEEKYKKAAQQVRANYDTYPRNPDGGHWHNRRFNGQLWVDGVVMSLMFLVRYGKYIGPETGDMENCYDECIKQLNIIFNRCQKDKTGLLYHGYCDSEMAGTDKPAWMSPVNGCSPEVWSEGLGWYAMALVEVLGIIPEGYPGRDSIVVQLQMLCKDLFKVQTKKGLFFQVVDKPCFNRNFLDTSGTAMFLYAFVKTRDLKILEGNDMDRAIRTGYSGVLSKCVQGIDGNIHILDACDGVCVQKSYDDYVDFPRCVDAKEAVAAVLWSLTAVEYGTTNT